MNTKIPQSYFFRKLLPPEERKIARLYFQKTEAYQELMEELGRKHCNICNCWIADFRKHLMTYKHAKQVKWNLECNKANTNWGNE